MRRRPVLSTTRTAQVFREMVSLRRDYRQDGTFFRMSEFWEDLCENSDEWTIKPYKSGETEDFKRKAGVVALGDRVTLTVDSKLMDKAKSGCALSNFILAHEVGHLGLDHFARSSMTKNFQLFSGPSGAVNAPPTLEELEANYAAVFFQCGPSLLDKNLDGLQLARQAFSDVYYVRKLQRLVQLDAFKNELYRQQRVSERIVL